ncbi:hypothetical protein E2C01_084656 [Portunus trituberculatus]|uniref:Uncharacterized protein n=1 Tax=Portunus trituberculatus TaxID=210409 RepID=A0A5B7J4S7_PORTR|nr:hypothetical protein [Portunus trituberculatus]
MGKEQGSIRLEMFGVAGRANRWGVDAQLSTPPFTYYYTVLPTRIATPRLSDTSDSWLAL